MEKIQYYVLTNHPKFLEVIKWITEHKLEAEFHLNRTRFWISTNTMTYFVFMLKYRSICDKVTEEELL